MKLGIMQPYFIPYIGYWQLINAVDKYVIYDDVNFIKGGWINRNRILLNGSDKMINVQMFQASPNKLINQVEVMNDPIYNKKLLKTIYCSYKKAPYFLEIYPLIENVINQNDKNLAKYLEYSIRQICEYLSIKTELIISSDIKKDNNLKGEEKVIEICKILNADVYYNAIGGKILYSSKNFYEQNIRLNFLETVNIQYSQFDHKFVSNLSIIDVMMFNSVTEIKKLLDSYNLC